MDSMHNTPATTAAPAQVDSTGIFQCGTCKRRYQRADHLTRHVRSHTRLKAYQCHICPKAFGRADLLKRHVLVHNSANGGSRRGSSPSAAPLHSRVTQACRACASNHLRCSEEKPCYRCTDKGINCLWDRLVESAITPPSIVTTETVVEVPEQSPCQALEMSDSPDNRRLMDVLTPQPSQAQVVLDFPDFAPLQGQWTPMGALDFHEGMSFELDDVDLRSLEAYNTNLPFQLDSRAQQDLDTNAPPGNSPDPCRPAAICTEAFRNYWKFRPQVQDHAAAEEHNLSLPSSGRDHKSPESRISLGRRITCARLNLSARDKILTSIIQSCRSEDLSRVVELFPTAELLDTLLQYYLTSPIVQSDCFLHAATFNPNTKRSELLAAMVAGGAVLTADPALSKLGLAIQECLRVAIPRHWERNNALTRDLELWQAFLILLEIGLWSGHNRKVEIAESFLQPLVTMMRRDGKLKRSGPSEAYVPSDNDNHDSLELAWRKWVEQESFKRVAFRVLEHDTNTSIALLVNPLISYAEIQVPIPDSAELWSAPSAMQWEASFLAGANSNSARPLALGDYVDNPESFRAYQNIVDTSIASFAFLSCVWRLSWDYIQLDSLQRAGSGTRRWNALLMSSRHDEILKLLINFRISTRLHGAGAVQMTMRLEHNLMHLHMPFEEIQLFAGMDGLEQACIVYPTLCKWVKGESARRAVWHGGQVLRAAKTFATGAITGPFAIMVYQASLALWAYGMLSKVQSSADQASLVISPPAAAKAQPQVVYLDGPEDIVTQRFIHLGGGSPCLQGSPGPTSQFQDVHLSQPDRVMAVMADILRRNHDEVFRPRLVDNLIHLIGGLQKASAAA